MKNSKLTDKGSTYSYIAAIAGAVVSGVNFESSFTNILATNMYA